jgi:hypothetical protein
MCTVCKRSETNIDLDAVTWEELQYVSPEDLDSAVAGALFGAMDGQPPVEIKIDDSDTDWRI